MIILIMKFKIIYRRLKMKLLILLFVLIPIINISCQTVGAVEDLTSKGVETEMSSKIPDSKDLGEKTKTSNSKDTVMSSKTPNSKDLGEKSKISNSKDTAGNSKNHNSKTPKS
jgi:hypothetical protein